MRKILNNCPKKQRSNCKGCNSCNRCRLRRAKYFWRTWCMTITLAVMLVVACMQLILVSIVKYNDRKLEKRSEEIQKELENYKTPEEVTRRNAQIMLQDIEPIIIIDSQAVIPKKVKAETVKEEQLEATISAYGPGETYFYWISDEDYLNLKKVVYQEARGENFEGQVAVAAVVLNRYASGDYSKFNCSSVTSVILQSGQFAPIGGVTEEQLKSCPSVTEAVQQALKGYDPTRLGFKNGATFFYQPETTYGSELDRRQGIETYRIGNHLFHNDLAF